MSSSNSSMRNYASSSLMLEYSHDLIMVFAEETCQETMPRTTSTKAACPISLTAACS